MENARWIVIGILLGALGLLFFQSGIGGGAPTPLPTYTPLPTNTPYPTYTPQPTATSTNTPFPTAPTDTPTTTSTPATPTNTPIPSSRILKGINEGGQLTSIKVEMARVGLEVRYRGNLNCEYFARHAAVGVIEAGSI